jgi:hypothetical protein
MIIKYSINKIINNYKTNSIELIVFFVLSFLNKVLNQMDTGKISFKYFFIKEVKL